MTKEDKEALFQAYHNAVMDYYSNRTKSPFVKDLLFVVLYKHDLVEEQSEWLERKSVETP